MTDARPEAQPRTLPATLDWEKHALFLDFDGTLAALQDRPEAVTLLPATVDVVEAALRATGGAVAIISGRALDDLALRSQPLQVALSGSHGAESRLPGKAVTGAAEHDSLAAAHAALSPLAARHGLLVERKPGAVALHYRGHPDLEDPCRAAVEEAAAAQGLRVMHGNMVSEAALPGVDKGTALRGFMSRPPFKGRRPVMIGDDTTDEDGFAAAQALGGFGLRIGGHATCAHYRVDDMDTALAWLGATLSDWN
jgi:trehalose 6-phosphate phosphatase